MRGSKLVQDLYAKAGNANVGPSLKAWDAAGRAMDECEAQRGRTAQKAHLSACSRRRRQVRMRSCSALARSRAASPRALSSASRSRCSASFVACSRIAQFMLLLLVSFSSSVTVVAHLGPGLSAGALPPEGKAECLSPLG